MRTNRVFGAAFLLTMSLAAPVTSAQDPADEDDLLPAVDTSAAAAEEGPGPDVVRNTSGDRVMDSIELSRTEIV